MTMATTLTKFTSKIFGAPRNVNLLGLRLWRRCRCDNITSKSGVSTSLNPKSEIGLLSKSKDHPVRITDNLLTVEAFPIKCLQIQGDNKEIESNAKIEVLINDSNCITTNNRILVPIEIKKIFLSFMPEDGKIANTNVKTQLNTATIVFQKPAHTEVVPRNSMERMQSPDPFELKFCCESNLNPCAKKKKPPKCPPDPVSPTCPPDPCKRQDPNPCAPNCPPNPCTPKCPPSTCPPPKSTCGSKASTCPPPKPTCGSTPKSDPCCPQTMKNPCGTKAKPNPCKKPAKPCNPCKPGK